MEHSMAPWTLKCHTAETPSQITGGCDWTIRSADGKSLAFEGQYNENASADAQLMAAAPDLLEALQLADCLLSGANMNLSVVEQKVRAAIAKARGQS